MRDDSYDPENPDGEDSPYLEPEAELNF